MRRALLVAALGLATACSSGSSSDGTGGPFDFRACMEAAETVGDENACENTEADIVTAVDAAIEDRCSIINLSSNDWTACHERISEIVRRDREAEIGETWAD